MCAEFAEPFSRIHGGNAPPGVIDFSAPLNPLGPPPWLKDIVEECAKSRVYARYPDPNYSRLREALADYYNVSPRELVVVAGASEALTLAPLVLRVKSIIVVEPSFGDKLLYSLSTGILLARVRLREHIVDLRAYFAYPLNDVIKAAKAMPKPVLVVIERPNNPTGSMPGLDVVEEVSRAISGEGYVVVDEAFIDITVADYSSAKDLCLDNIITIRSLTKALATPGLRLGAIISCSSRIALRLDAARQPWNIDSITTCCFEKLLSSYAREVSSYMLRAKKLISSEQAYLYEMFKRFQDLGLLVYESKAPYMLLRHSKCLHPHLQSMLLRLGVYVRDCSSYWGLGPAYSRVSVRVRRDNEKLVYALIEALKTCQA